MLAISVGTEWGCFFGFKFGISVCCLMGYKIFCFYCVCMKWVVVIFLVSASW
jgi:hypothetical protein